MEWLICTIIAVVFLSVWYIVTMNRFRKTLVRIKEAESGIDVALTKRYDTLKKMMDVCRGYMHHEKETLFETIKLRKGMSINEMNEESAKMDQVVSGFNFVAENYPQLNSSKNFIILQQSVADVEEHLQAARRIYNNEVSTLNQGIVSFPSSVVAKMCRVKMADFFVAEETKKQDIDLTF